VIFGKVDRAPGRVGDKCQTNFEATSVSSVTEHWLYSTLMNHALQACGVATGRPDNSADLTVSGRSSLAPFR
jgi:hypothetical protein